MCFWASACDSHSAATGCAPFTGCFRCACCSPHGLSQFNCCRSPDFEAPGCKTGSHMQDVDDWELRGHSTDARTPQDVVQRKLLQPTSRPAGAIEGGGGKKQ
eukprot:m.200810 g.200810  ORF g.200810 m.200810 type:complete len:102 (+) comp10667_c1_seq3:507-812(+)